MIDPTHNSKGISVMGFSLSLNEDKLLEFAIEYHIPPYIEFSLPRSCDRVLSPPRGVSCTYAGQLKVGLVCLYLLTSYTS